MEYHIMVFQTLCKGFAVPAIHPASFFAASPCGSEPARDSGLSANIYAD